MSFSRVYRKTIVEAFLLLLLATSASVLGPYLIKVFIDDYLRPTNWDMPAIWTLAAIYTLSQLIGNEK